MVKRYPTLDIHFSFLGARVWSSLHLEACSYVLRRDGVEFGRFVRFRPPIDVGPFARLRQGRNAVWESLFSRHETIGEIGWNGETATRSKSAACWFPLRQFGKAVSKGRFVISISCRMAAGFAPSGGAHVRAALRRRRVRSLPAFSSDGPRPVYTAALRQKSSTRLFLLSLRDDA